MGPPKHEFILRKYYILIYLWLTGPAAAHPLLASLAVSSQRRAADVIIAGHGRLALRGMTRNWLDENSIGLLLA